MQPMLDIHRVYVQFGVFYLIVIFQIIFCLIFFILIIYQLLKCHLSSGLFMQWCISLPFSFNLKIIKKKPPLCTSIRIVVILAAINLLFWGWRVWVLPIFHRFGFSCCIIKHYHTLFLTVIISLGLIHKIYLSLIIWDKKWLFSIINGIYCKQKIINQLYTV